MRGVVDDGQDLVISRDYIKEGMRARAQDLVTQELGPRTDRDIQLALEGQVKAERWTQLDRQLVRDADRHGVIELAPDPERQPDPFRALKVGRLRRLASLGLAHQVGPGQWTMDEVAETTLRELGERGDIIKRIHRGLAERGIERATASYVLAGESLDAPVIGRLVDRSLDDELQGTAYAVIDGVDGRAHHIKLPDLDAAGDSARGSIVKLRKFDDAQGRQRVALVVRSDLAIEDQVTASGATWLDRQAVKRDPAAFGQTGFGAEVRDAMQRRAEQLIEQGLAERRAQGIVFSQNLIGTLRRREVEALAERLAAETGQPFNAVAAGEYVAGSYRQRFALASGRFAMIDDGLGFQLVRRVFPAQAQPSPAARCPPLDRLGASYGDGSVGILGGGGRREEIGDGTASAVNLEVEKARAGARLSRQRGLPTGHARVVEIRFGGGIIDPHHVKFSGRIEPRRFREDHHMASVKTCGSMCGERHAKMSPRPAWDSKSTRLQPPLD